MKNKVSCSVSPPIRFRLGIGQKILEDKLTSASSKRFRVIVALVGHYLVDKQGFAKCEDMEKDELLRRHKG